VPILYGDTIAKTTNSVAPTNSIYDNHAMRVFTLGLNHTTAPLDVRGRFALTLSQLGPSLHALRERLLPSSSQSEIALLSTCNRTELYCAAPPQLVEPAVDWLAALGGMTPTQLREHAYLFHGDAAARHAFRVASGLDSMVLGEPQILGQMKHAVREADTAGTLGTTLHQLFQRSFSIAKNVRSATEIGAHSISMAASTVRLASQLFEDLGQLNVLFIGAGEMIELVATHFAAHKPRSMAVANRTLERGEKLAQRLGAQTLRLADIPQHLAQFDVLISCTASSLPIIGLGAVERALKVRKHRPMFMVDLAVPRDIEIEVAQLPDVYLYTVDDLAALVQTAGAKRQAAVEQAEAIIDAGVQSFAHWLGARDAVPLIQALHTQADSWRTAEIAKAHKQLAKGAPIDAVFESLARGLTQKILHGSLAELHSGTAAQRSELTHTISRLFLRHTAHDPADDAL
jgi:glutamyl-tRNA reductase